MDQLYKKSNIIRFIYQELDLFAKLEMEFAMEDDSTLMEHYQYYKSGYDALPNVAFSPKKSITDSILAYSKTQV